MKNIVFVAVMAALCAAPAFAQSSTTDIAAAAQAAKDNHQSLIASSGARLGRISRIEADGAVAIIFDDRLVIIPAATLSVDEDGRLVTSLSRREVARIGR